MNPQLFPPPDRLPLTLPTPTLPLSHPCHPYYYPSKPCFSALFLRLVVAMPRCVIRGKNGLELPADSAEYPSQPLKITNLRIAKLISMAVTRLATKATVVVNPKCKIIQVCSVVPISMESPETA